MTFKLRTNNFLLKSVAEISEMVMALFLLANSGYSSHVPSNEKLTPPLEHRVTFEEAKSAASKLLPHLMVEASCKECTKNDSYYCMGKNVLHDHCCCDRKFHEVFPYMEHACYKSSNVCQTIAQDCGEYYRLLVCCCHRMLGSKWKEIALGRGDSSQIPNTLTLFTIILLELI